jgi:hypothetical protein
MAMELNVVVPFRLVVRRLAPVCVSMTFFLLLLVGIFAEIAHARPTDETQGSAGIFPKLDHRLRLPCASRTHERIVDEDVPRFDREERLSEPHLTQCWIVEVERERVERSSGSAVEQGQHERVRLVI